MMFLMSREFGDVVSQHGDTAVEGADLATPATQTYVRQRMEVRRSGGKYSVYLLKRVYLASGEQVDNDEELLDTFAGVGPAAQLVADFIDGSEIEAGHQYLEAVAHAQKEGLPVLY